MKDVKDSEALSRSAFATTVWQRIQAAVNTRKACGVERAWVEDQEYYAGVDDLNRSNELSDYAKPQDASGGLTARRPVIEEGRCTEFFNITAPYVDAAEARLGDMLLPSLEWNFAIKPTPIPELEGHEEDDTPITLQDGQTTSVADVVRARNAEAAEAVEKAETQIKDWLTDSDYRGALRHCLHDAALVGTGVLKGPFPATRKSTVVLDNKIVIEEKIYPKTCRVDYWDIFPAPDCKDDIHEGAYIVERCWLSRTKLLDLINDPEGGYIKEAIISAVSKRDEQVESAGGQKQSTFEVFYYYGDITKKDLNCFCGEDEEEEDDELDEIMTVPGCIAMLNGEVIKAYLNPLDSGKFPFSFIRWKSVSKSPWGIGVARQGRFAQKMVLSGARALVDNMALSAVPQLAVIKSALTPSDGKWTPAPGKTWYINQSSGIVDARQAIQPIIIPTMQQELSAIIDQGRRMMEDATGIVAMLQGQQGNAPDTLGGMQMLQNNATAVLRRVARNTDAAVTQLIQRYYDWLLLYGDLDQKGDVTITAIGSTALVERELQSMQLPQLLQLSLDPRFKASPVKVFREIVKAWRFEESAFDMTPEEEAELKQMMEAQQQQSAPQVEAAQIRAQTDMQKTQMQIEARLAEAQLRGQTDVQKMQMDTDRDTIHVMEQAQRTQIMADAKQQELALKKELALLEYEKALLDYANKNELKLTDVKAKLAEVSMKLNMQRELAMNATSPAPQVANPPTEPPGRAPNGEAFQK